LQIVKLYLNNWCQIYTILPSRHELSIIHQLYAHWMQHVQKRPMK
jgi:hypothetical protein